ncbi:MAG: response regulator [Candidatus Auribacterota bacterium]
MSSNQNKSDKTKVLIIEDEQVIIDLLTMFLEEAGDFSVTTALNGKVGFEAYEQIRPDLILLDLQMPVMDGLTFLREFRKIDSATPIIIVSSCWQVSREEVFQLGATAWVNKPFRLTELMEAINETLDNRPVELKIHALPAQSGSFPGVNSVSLCPENKETCRQKRVAIVQHNKETLKLLASFMEKEGYEVTAVLQDAVNWAELLRREYGLIFLSVDMFNYSNLTKLNKSAPVIVNTANNDEKARKVGFIFGADAWITMPFDFSELKTTVELLMGKTPQELESLRMEQMMAFLQDSVIETTRTGDQPA